MAWTDHLIPRGRWLMGTSVFPHSRAGARWIAALVTAIFIFLFVARSYHQNGYANLLVGGKIGAAPQIGSSSGKQQQLGSGTITRLPAWIDTPPAFDVSQVHGGYKAPASPPAVPTGLPPRLAEAAAQFLARPALSHEQARAQNEVECPREQLEEQVNGDQLRSDRKGWLEVDAEKVADMRMSAVRFLAARAGEEGEGALMGPGLFAGGKVVEKGSRGVVIAAGNKRTVERAIVCVKEMQKLGWKGPVEVWHFEGELTDEKDREKLKALGVGIHVVSVKKTPGQWKNFELKAEAILRSSFDEVLYLDSDNFPLADVTSLFESPQFKDPQGGRAVFWPDLNRDHPDNAIHRVLGVPCHDAWELDSGQVLVAKSGNEGLNLAALWLARYMQTDGDYWFSGGDKDTFRYAHLALGIPYTPAPRWLSVLGSPLKRRFRIGDDDDDEDDEDLPFCGAAMLQYGLAPPRAEHADSADPTHPEPLFVHANLLKHMSGARKGQVFTHLRRLAPGQDDVRVIVSEAKEGQEEKVLKKKKGPLDGVVGGARELAGRGLCSDIWSFAEGEEGTVVETVDAKEAFGGTMAGFEDAYFGSGARAGGWKRRRV